MYCTPPYTSLFTYSRCSWTHTRKMLWCWWANTAVLLLLLFECWINTAWTLLYSAVLCVGLSGDGHFRLAVAAELVCLGQSSVGCEGDHGQRPDLVPHGRMQRPRQRLRSSGETSLDSSPHICGGCTNDSVLSSFFFFSFQSWPATDMTKQSIGHELFCEGLKGNWKILKLKQWCIRPLGKTVIGPPIQPVCPWVAVSTEV